MVSLLRSRGEQERRCTTQGGARTFPLDQSSVSAPPSLSQLQQQLLRARYRLSPHPNSGAAAPSGQRRLAPRKQPCAADSGNDTLSYQPVPALLLSVFKEKALSPSRKQLLWGAEHRHRTDVVGFNNFSALTTCFSLFHL